MRTRLAIIFLLMTPLVTSAQFDGRRGEKPIEMPRFERPTSNNDRGRRDDSSTSDTYAIPEPPNPLPGLANQYRSVREWFRADVFPDAPSMVEPANLSDLLRTLVYLKDFADGKLRNLRYRTSELETRYRNLQAQIARNGDVGATLRLEAAAIETDLERSQRETRETEEKLASQTSLLNRITEISKQMSVEVASAKDDIFANLYDAAIRGRLLSPGNYRPLPKPLTPVYAESGAQDEPTPVSAIAIRPSFPAAPYAAAEPVRAVPIFAPLRAQTIRRTPVSEAEVQEKLQQINASLPLISVAYNALNEASRRVNALEQTASASEYLVEQTRARLESLRSQDIDAASAMNSVKARLRDAGDAYQRQREKFPVQCLEYAVVKYYEKKVKDFMVKKFPDVPEVLPAIDARNLSVFTNVMRHVVELGGDTLKVIERAPDALAGNVEDPAELQAALDDAVTRFNVNLFSDLSGLPPPIAKFFHKRLMP